MTDDGGCLTTTVSTALPVDLGRTLGPLRRGRHDPCVRVDATGAWWRATWTPAGPATVRVAPVPTVAGPARPSGPSAGGDDAAVAGGRLPQAFEVRAWGPGAAAALDAAPALLGAGDDLDGFAPGGIVRELHRRFPGLRASRSGAVFEALVPSVLEQKVIGQEARAAYAAIVRAWGEPAPGPVPLLLPPAPAVLAAQPSWAFHPLGVEQRRANTIRVAASRAARVAEAAGMAPGDAARRLTALPGVGPWTAAEVAAVALGDPDAVPVGDFHLPHLVSWALAGEPRGTDERMLALLAPYAGHRGRVLRLLAAGGLWAPRHGPRLAFRRLQHH